MKKRMNIAIASVVSLFIAVNIHLLFSEKSKVPKTIHVSQYERMSTDQYEETVKKEGLLSPEEMYTIYVGDGESIDQWLVKEGDRIQVGEEIARLQTERADSQMAAWEAEEEGLLDQLSAIDETISDLEYERDNAQSGANHQSTETAGETEIELNIQVDLHQDGSYSQAIAAAERERSEIERQLKIIEAQLSQNPSRPALISPINGTVAEIHKNGSILSADIYSEEKLIKTYVQLEQWQDIEIDDTVRLQQNSLKTVIEGTVAFISEVPASEDKWRHAYEQLDPQRNTHSLDLYEIHIRPIEPLQELPYGAKMNAEIVVNEADAISVNKQWLLPFDRQTKTVWTLNNEGKAVNTQVSVPFYSHDRAVITDGIEAGDIAIKYPADTASNVITSLPFEFPNKSEWRAFGWKNYFKYAFLK